jgi:hypothetical protein
LVTERWSCRLLLLVFIDYCLGHHMFVSGMNPF